MALPRRKAGSQSPARRGGQPRRPVEADNPFTVSEPDVDDDDDLIEDVGGDDDGYDEDPVYNDSRSQADDGFADENDYDDDEELSEPAEQDDEAYVEDPDDEGLGSADLEEEPEPEPLPRRGRRGNPRGGQRGRIRNNRDDGPRGRGRKPRKQEAPSRKSMMAGLSGLMKSGKGKAKPASKPQRNTTVEDSAPSSSALLLSVSSSAAGFAIFLFMLGIFLGILHPGSGSLVLVFVLLLALPFIGLFGGLISLKKDAAHKSAAITAIVMSLVSILTVGVMYMQMDAISNKVMNDITQAVSVVNSRTTSHESSSSSLTDDEDSGSVHSRAGSSTSKKSSSTGTKSKSNTSSHEQSGSNDDSDSGSSSSSDSGQLKSE